MRPTLFGKEIHTYQDKFLGINLGYNFYAEHEYHIEEIPARLNNYSIVSGSMDMIYRRTIGQTIQLKRKISAQNKVVARWDNTPFKDKVLYPCTIYTKREVIIDNTGIQNKYNRFLTNNGNYTLLYLGLTPESWRKHHGDRRKFTEEELLYMSDYNTDMSVNIGFMTKGRNKIVKDNIGFAAAWQGGMHEIMLLVSSEVESTKHIVEGIISAIKKGSLAVVQEEGRLFSDRGLILLDLENCYNSFSK